MNRVTNNKGTITMLFCIFFISISLFVYQILLTRLYSAVLSYHYVFLTTSFAILGLGIGSITAYRLRKNKTIGLKHKKGNENQTKTGLTRQIHSGSVLLAASYIAVFAINYLIPYVNSLLVYIVLGTVPFLVGGYLYSILFTEYSNISGKLYFMDLIGSGIGSVAVILLLDNAGMFRTIVTICIIALIPVVILPARTKKLKLAGFVLPIILLTSLFLPAQNISNIETNYKGILNNTSKTFGIARSMGMSPELVFTEWNAFSRTDVIKLPTKPGEMILTIDGSANAPMYEFDGNIESLDRFKKDTGFIPFSMENNHKTLLIGPGGGRDVLYALAGGSTDITAVEINTASIDAVLAFGVYNGNIYDRPEVKVFGEDGRSFVRKSEEKYDLIFLSLVMTNTSQGMGYALSENYIYTVEAMEDYLDQLNDKGRVAFLAHDKNDLGKIVTTAIKALENNGIPVKDAPGHIAMFARNVPQGHDGFAIHNPVIIIKNQPFLEHESTVLSEYAIMNGDIPIYVPFVFEEGPLQLIKEGSMTYNEYLNAFRTNVTPATDDNPYFYNFNKGIPSTLTTILIIVMLGAIVMFSPFITKKGNLKPTLYFGLLGAGFMMIEIPLIQKFILYMGHPTLAFTFVLAALLIGSGLGGYMSTRKLFNVNIKGFYLPPVLVVAVNLLLLATLGFIFKTTASLELMGRIVIASIIVMIQGFFMGMPFPRGIKLMGANRKGEIIPVMWGVNGVMSVIGSVLSVILSMSIGFTGAMITGTIVYLIIASFKKL